MENLFFRGLELFNSRDFFECHDTWEELWKESSTPDKLFYQGLVQVAVGYYHYENKNFKGAQSQFSKAIPKLESYAPSYHGIDVERLVTVLREHRAAFQDVLDGALAEYTLPDFPTLAIDERNANLT